MEQDMTAILRGEKGLGRYPMEKLKRVDQPTTVVTDDIQRVAAGDAGFERAARGDFGEFTCKERNRPQKYPVTGAEIDMARHLVPMEDGPVADSQAPLPDDPAALSRHIKSLGHFLRADIVGICRLPRYAVYSQDKDGQPIELNHQYAIVVLVDQNYATMKASNGHDWISNAQSHLSYSSTAFISCVMADYIRRLGYPARAHHCGLYQVLIPPLLLQAGIGEMCRLGNSVLNPFLGVRFKAAAITTDLPLAPDRPVDFGLQKFCQVCKKCASECPSHAISSGDKVMYNGYEVWPLDVERCTRYRVTNQNGASCGRCIKVCPWNKPAGGVHSTARWLAQHTPWLDSFLVNMDDLFGYDKARPGGKWWFDLELVDGTLCVPRSNADKQPNP